MRSSNRQTTHDELPLPRTPTRFPWRSISCLQRAEWNTSPLKDSIPGNFGNLGTTSTPMADTRAVARVTCVSPVRTSRVSMRQTFASTSHSALSSDVWKRQCGRRSYLSVTLCIYSRISGCVPWEFFQSDLRSVERE